MADKLEVRQKGDGWGVWNSTKNKWEFNKTWNSKKDAERYTRPGW